MSERSEAEKAADKILLMLPRPVMIDTWLKNTPRVAEIIQRLLNEKNAEIKYRDDIIGLSPDGDRHGDLVKEIKRLKQQLANIDRLSNRCQFFFDQLTKAIKTNSKPLKQQLAEATNPAEGGDSLAAQ